MTILKFINHNYYNKIVSIRMVIIKIIIVTITIK